MKHFTTTLLAIVLACVVSFTASAQLSVRQKKPAETSKSTQKEQNSKSSNRPTSKSDSKSSPRDKADARDKTDPKGRLTDNGPSKPTPGRPTKGNEKGVKERPDIKAEKVDESAKEESVDDNAKLSSDSVVVAVKPSNEPPQGKLIYCSYSTDRPAGGGYTYCELVLDGEEPTVNVNRDRNCRFAENQIQAFTDIDDEQIDSIQQLIIDKGYFRLDGYNEIEAIPGATTYRIHIEFDSGEKITARWCATRPRDEAEQAFNDFVRFFTPWFEQVPQKTLPK